MKKYYYPETSVCTVSMQGMLCESNTGFGSDVEEHPVGGDV